MGKRDKAPVVVISDDDDEEANEDLSLKIVEKSLLQACNSSAAQVDSVEVVGLKTGKKAKKLKAKVIKQQHQLDQIVEVVNVKDEENTDIIQDVKNAEVDSVEKSDSLVLRKLLRGPRYFDPPDSGGGWGACYNCGEDGHTAANCTSAKRKKPCFICGSVEHQAKQCLKGKDCYICKKGGHRAKDCPENDKGKLKIWKICLKCGDSVHHDMFSCDNDYSAEDLKGIQCYICKSFGHLCCVDFVDTTPIQLSCYRCGQLGHAGVDCGKSRMEKNVGTPGKCYKCQEVGHIAKNCPSSIKDSGSENVNVRSPGKCHGCGEAGHIARNCPSSTKVEKKKSNLSTPTQKFGKEKIKQKKAKSATSEVFKAHKRRKTESVEDGTPTPYGIKKRGDWVTEEPVNASSREFQMHQWDSPVTPTCNRSMPYSSGVNGHDVRFDDTRYGSNGPLYQPRGQYGHGHSREPYREYSHAPSDELHHLYRHDPLNGSYNPYEVRSDRPYHQYVGSPNGSSPSVRGAHPHHSFVPSPSQEAAHGHHQSYNQSSRSFQPRYQTTRFSNSSSDVFRRSYY